MSHDPSYDAARATEERRLAMASQDPKVRRIHLEMAAQYAARAGADATQTNDVPPSEEQQTG